MRHSTERFLARPHRQPAPTRRFDSYDACQGSGVPVDRAALAARVRDAVAEVVKKQIEAGIDLVSDGEMSKPSYATYIKDKLPASAGLATRSSTRILPSFPAWRSACSATPGAHGARRRPATGQLACSTHKGCPHRRRQPQCGGRGHGSRGVYERGIAGRNLAVLPQRPLQGPRGLPLCHRRGHAARI